MTRTLPCVARAGSFCCLLATLLCPFIFSGASPPTPEPAPGTLLQVYSNTTDGLLFTSAAYIGVDSHNRIVLVPQGYDGLVLAYNGSLIARFSYISWRPNGLVVHAATDDVYVNDWYYSALFIFNASAGWALQAMVPMGDKVCGVALLLNGNVLQAGWDYSASEYSVAQSEVIRYWRCCGHNYAPEGMAASPVASALSPAPVTILMARLRNKTDRAAGVYVYNSSDSSSPLSFAAYWDLNDTVQAPAASAYDRAGRLHIVDKYQQRLTVLDGDGQVVWRFENSSVLQFPIGVAVGRDGTVFVLQSPGLSYQMQVLVMQGLSDTETEEEQRKKESVVD